MRAEVLSVKDRGISKLSGAPLKLYCFKGDDGNDYSSWVDQSMRNATRWANVNVGDRLSDLRVKKNNLIDADSQFHKEA